MEVVLRTETDEHSCVVLPTEQIELAIRRQLRLAPRAPLSVRVGGADVSAITFEEAGLSENCCVEVFVHPPEPGRARAALRVRPLNERESAWGSRRAVEVQSAQGEVRVTIAAPPEEPQAHEKPPAELPPARVFSFEHVFDEDATQAEIYDALAAPVVHRVMGHEVAAHCDNHGSNDNDRNNSNGAIIAYGQTGAGKTYSMWGGDASCRGIIPRAVEHIFEASAAEQGEWDTTVQVSCIAIDAETLTDVLAPQPHIRNPNLRIRRGKEGMFVAELSRHKVESAAACLYMLERGRNNMTVAATAMGRSTARVCTILQLSLNVFCMLMYVSIDERTHEHAWPWPRYAPLS